MHGHSAVPFTLASSRRGKDSRSQNGSIWCGACGGGSARRRSWWSKLDRGLHEPCICCIRDRGRTTSHPTVHRAYCEPHSMPLHATFVDFVADVTPQQSAPPPSPQHGIHPHWTFHAHTCTCTRAHAFVHAHMRAQTNVCVPTKTSSPQYLPAQAGSDTDPHSHSARRASGRAS
jgi:hypothetical protein